MSWANLRAEFPALSSAQLHRLLTQYQLASAMGPMSAWEPGPQDHPDAFKSGKPLPWAGPHWGQGSLLGASLEEPTEHLRPLPWALPPLVSCPALSWGHPQVGDKKPTVHGQVVSSRLRSEVPPALHEARGWGLTQHTATRKSRSHMLGATVPSTGDAPELGAHVFTRTHAHMFL